MFQQFDEATQQWVKMSQSAYENLFGKAPTRTLLHTPIGQKAVENLSEDISEGYESSRHLAQDAVNLQAKQAQQMADLLGPFNNEFTAHLFRAFNVWNQTCKVASLTVLDRAKLPW